MLVLSRKAKESIVIGDGIEIVVTEVRNGRAKIGIIAPLDVRILRKELVVCHPPQQCVDSAKEKTETL